MNVTPKKMCNINVVSVPVPFGLFPSPQPQFANLTEELLYDLSKALETGDDDKIVEAGGCVQVECSLSILA
jgi:hypothetical protein